MAANRPPPPPPFFTDWKRPGGLSPETAPGPRRRRLARGNYGHAPGGGEGQGRPPASINYANTRAPHGADLPPRSIHGGCLGMKVAWEGGAYCCAGYLRGPEASRVPHSVLTRADLIAGEITRETGWSVAPAGEARRGEKAKFPVSPSRPSCPQRAQSKPGPFGK